MTAQALVSERFIKRYSDRPWPGEYHLVAIYDRALSAEEVSQNFAARLS